MIRESAQSPYDPPKLRAIDQQFRVGVVPATVVGFIGCVAVLFGLMVVQNVLRDAMNGYDTRYLLLASLLPTTLFGFGFVCFLASFELKRGRWKRALKIMTLLLPIAIAFIVFVRSFA